MRLSKVELTGFRGFAREVAVDLNASAVILVGTNGTGKTSLFDAVLWCLTGELRRLGDAATVVSLYSSSGQARVRLELISNRETLIVTRSFDGTAQRFQLQIGGREFHGDAAKVRLLEMLWPDALATADASSPLYMAMTRGVYLQQDLVREFLDADTEQDRFKAMSELLGTGRVTELQSQLDSARTAWSRATNQYVVDRTDFETRLAQLRADLEALSHIDDDYEKVSVRVADWLTKVRRSGVETGSIRAADSLDEAQDVRRAHRLLAAEWQRIDERVALMREVLTDLAAVPGQPAPLDSTLELAVSELRGTLAKARDALVEAERRSAEERERYVMQRDSALEMAALANLALKHIDGSECPVCGQPIVSAEVHERLHQLIESGPTVRPPDSTELTRAAGLVRELETRLTNVEQSLATHQSEIATINRQLDSVRRRATDLGVAAEPDITPVLSDAMQADESKLKVLAELRAEGDGLLIDLARHGEQGRRVELANVIQQEQAQLESLSAEIALRETTGAVAVRILEALRGATSDVVARQLNDMGPLLQRIYGRIDPHPSFRVVRLVSSERRGRGQMSAEVADPSMNLSSRWPSAVMSSSQTNALAVSIFLTLNLGLPKLPLETAMLDDPLQSLDDVNLLGLIDLLRRTQTRRQLIVSTHDKRFGQLLARKLRPVADGERTVVLELGDWGREGPSIDFKEVLRETRPFRVIPESA